MRESSLVNISHSTQLNLPIRTFHALTVSGYLVDFSDTNGLRPAGTVIFEPVES